MHYTCKNCKYEFEINTPPHPHNNLFLQIPGMLGCPTCAKALAKEKICPKCESKDLIMSINNEFNKK